MKAIAITIAATLLASCAGTDSHQTMLENSNALRVDPAPPGQPYEFVVSIRNVKDFGYDPDNKATRDAQAVRALSAQCAKPRVVGETVIATGEYLLGNPKRTYAIQVSCRS